MDPEEYHHGPISQDTVNSLRKRLHVMKEVFGDSEDDDQEASDKLSKVLKKSRRRNCMDTIIDGSMMGVILFLCLCMVLGAAFFAYKNLYFAVMKKIYPEQSEL